MPEKASIRITKIVTFELSQDQVEFLEKGMLGLIGKHTQKH